jgi:hypothetical protein
VISPRYVPAICVLLALALVPTIMHSYSADRAIDGRTTAAIPTALAGYQSTPTDRNAGWGKRRFNSEDWLERDYTDGRNRVRLTVVRSFDAKSVYHHPELAIAYSKGFAGSEVRRAADRPEVPIQVLKPAPGNQAIAMYALHYGTRFIDNPIVFQLRTAGELLVTRRKPMTLFFVVDDRATEEETFEHSPARTVLFAAIDGFLRQG